MYIDGDTHYWPVRFIERVDHPGRGHVEFKKGAGEMIRYGEKFPGDAATYYRDGKKIHSFSETRWNLQIRHDVMEREGFDYQVVIPDNRPLIYEVEPSLGNAMARAYNDTVAEDIGGSDRFIPISWVYLPDVAEAVRELRRSVTALGFKGVKLMGGHQNCDLDAEVLWPFYEEVCRLDVPVLVHPGTRVFEAQDCHPWLVGSHRYDGFKMLATALGFPLTYMVSAARLIMSGTLDRFPNLRFAFFEGGIGWVPWLMKTLNHHTLSESPGTTSVNDFFKGRDRLKKEPSAYFEQLYVAAIAWEDYLPKIVEIWPDHNIIIGSDFDHGDAISTWPNTVEPIKAMSGLSDRDKDKILGGNAMKLFRMKEAH
jgi:predicted TIM-barrel fold metal-dependent hydrolase